MQKSARPLFAIIVAGFVAMPLGAASPELNLILPRGGQRGTEAVVNFHGARLADAQELITYQAGLHLEKLEVVNPAHIKATIKIAPDCPLGEHSLRLRCASGTSSLRTFWVGTLPSVDEKEPNNQFATPQSVPMNCTVQGVITPEDVDYFVVEAKKGQRLSVEVEGMRLGTAFFDPAVAILNAKRFELATCDDIQLLKQDCCCSIVVPEDGNYIIRLRESAFGGSASSYYRLHIGTFPRPTVAFPLGGKIGEELEVTLLGDAAGELRTKVKMTSPPPIHDVIRVRCDDAGGTSPTALPIRANDLTGVNEIEPNDGAAQATPGTAPCAFNGRIDKPSDHDCFKFAAKKGEVLDIRCYARKLGSPLDPVIWISYGDGRYITANDDAEGSPDSILRFTVPEDKEYVVGIRDHLFKGGPLFAYRIEVTPIQPRLVVLLPAYGLPPTQERQTIDVPQGNRYAALVQMAGRDIGGQVEVGVQGLPAGVAGTLNQMPAGMTNLPIVFEATKDAKVGGTLGSLTIAPNPKNDKCRCFYAQTVDMVFGQNIVSYSQTSVDRLAMTVAEAVPFSINVIEPKASLVRNGVMQIKVVAERRDGHKAPISLQALFNPPGTATNAVTIPEGQNEAVLTMTANGGAAVGQWPYVVMAQSAVKDGPAWVSSQLIKLNIAVQPMTVAFERAAAEQGKELSLRGTVAIATPFEGAAKVKMFGLPNKVTAADIEIQAGAKDLSIPVTLDATSPPGQHRNLICQVTLVQNGEPVVYTAGVGELRIDKPAPPKAGQPVAAAPAKPQPAPAAKPLSRLEQLRKEQSEKAGSK